MMNQRPALQRMHIAYVQICSVSDINDIYLYRRSLHFNRSTTYTHVIARSDDRERQESEKSLDRSALDEMFQVY